MRSDLVPALTSRALMFVVVSGCVARERLGDAVVLSLFVPLSSVQRSEGRDELSVVPTEPVRAILPV